jgi:hypothetical protein
MRASSHLRWCLAALLALVAQSGCDSPTLPLPPPASPEEVVVSDDATHVDLAGTGAIPGALVLVFNDEPSVLAGSIVTADGSGRYRMTAPLDLRVSTLNQFEIWQRVGTHDSSLVSFVVRARVVDVPSDAGADAGEARTETGGDAGEGEGAANAVGGD